MAKLLDLSQSAYASIETGRSELTLRRLDDIAQLFDMDAYSLMTVAKMEDEEVQQQLHALSNQVLGPLQTYFDGQFKIMLMGFIRLEIVAMLKGKSYEQAIVAVHEINEQLQDGIDPEFEQRIVGWMRQAALLNVLGVFRPDFLKMEEEEKRNFLLEMMRPLYSQMIFSLKMMKVAQVYGGWVGADNHETIPAL